MKRVPVGAAIVICLTVAACGGSSSRSVTASTSVTTAAAVTTISAANAGYMTAQQVAARLAGLGCTATPATRNEAGGGIQPVSSLDCTINGEPVMIDEYRNADQVASQIQLAKGPGCAIAKQFGVTSASYVVGVNWTVTPKTEITAKAIRDAIGGTAKVDTIHC